MSRGNKIPSWFLFQKRKARSQRQNVVYFMPYDFSLLLLTVRVYNFYIQGKKYSPGIILANFICRLSGSTIISRHNLNQVPIHNQKNVIVFASAYCLEY